MTKREAQRYMHLSNVLGNLGLHQPEIDTLLRCSRTLHTWAEHECNGEIEREEAWAVERAAWPKADRWWDGATWTTRANRRTYDDYDKDATTATLPTDAAWRATGSKPYRVYGQDIPNATIRRFPTPDRETGALKRAQAIAEAHGLTIYHQGDPRGCCLYILRPGDVPEGQDPGAYYSRGIAVCID